MLMPHLPSNGQCLLHYGTSLLVIHPQSIAELAKCVAESSSLGRPIFAKGGDTCFADSLPLSQHGMVLDMRHLSQVIDYPARDMTITVQAGITMAKLNEILAAENQRLPIDVPFSEQATVGGCIATNTSGPRRYGFGTFRDYVIGITTINDEGQETKAGGRVVKNVAGYDLCKLHIGAHGTLGIISQVTLKVKPRPEHQAMVVVGCQADLLAELVDLVHASRTQPVCIEAVNELNARRINQVWNLNLPSDAWVLIVGFENNREAVDWQVDQLVRELLAKNIQEPFVVKGPESNPIWHALTHVMADSESAITFQANLLSSATADYCRFLNDQESRPRLQAHAGNGIVIGHFGPDLQMEAAKTFFDHALTAAQSQQGNLVLLKCPPDWKKVLPIWGAQRGDTWLMRAVKNKLDPRGVFNPGRFVDGI
jgi:glycolate oxidase FAD binding subunit